MSNSVDPDETAHYEPSHLDLCCLRKPINITRGSKRVEEKLCSHWEKTPFYEGFGVPESKQEVTKSVFTPLKIYRSVDIYAIL